MHDGPFGAVIDGFTLKDALARLKPAIVTKGGKLPILTHVRFEANLPGQIVLTTSDLDLTLQTTIEASVGAAGVCVVPFDSIAKAVSDFTKKNTSNVTLYYEPDTTPNQPAPTVCDFGNATFTIDGADITLRTGRNDEWPVMSDWDTLETETLSVDLDALIEVAKSSAGDVSRPILTGALIEANGVYVATDSYRLARIVTDEEREHKPKLLPASVTAILAKTKMTGRVDADFSDREVRFVLPDLTIFQRMIEGEFPNYRGLIPASSPAAVDADINDLRPAVDKITKLKVALKGGSETPLRITNDPDGLKVAAVVQDVGETKVIIPGKLDNLGATAGLNLEQVAFNPTFLQALLVDVADDAKLVGVDNLKPWTVTWDSPIGTHTRLLMPVRVS